MLEIAAVLFYLALLVKLICFVMVLVQMSKHGEGGLVLVCIILSLCGGLGTLIAFVFGWSRARQWNISRLMTVWTVALAILCLSGTIVYVFNPVPSGVHTMIQDGPKWPRLAESFAVA
jgi:hypothetical protein